ncbi:GerAB/ArcD/ProY family transporter [Pseudogracilibacillus sp. ICA-222130]|uniref:GerAB/ArcD/ProY family transporter n=1 Tax=Pseudogracilibacillus sp. ICA-222130 TaxID=3134655 RepID=UPI0030BD445D
MNNEGKTILSYQLFFLLIQTQIGVSIVSLPHDVFNTAKGDGWISVLLTGVVVQCIIFMYMFIIKRFPTYSWKQVCEALFGKVIGKFIVLLYILYFICLASMTLAKYALLLSAWMMPRTPSWVLLLLMLIIVLYIVTAKLEAIAQFYVLTSVILLVYIGFNIYAWKEANLTFILPIGQSGVPHILEGIIKVFPSFSGIELLLILHIFVHAEKREILKVATISNVCLTIFYTFITLTSLVFLSPKELKLVPEPVLYLVKSFSFKIIERPDLIFTSIWIVLVATTLTMFIYATKYLSLHMYKKGKSQFVTIFLLVVCYIIAIPLRKVYILQTVSEYFQYAIIAFMVVLPLIFFLITFIFSKKEVEQ